MEKYQVLNRQLILKITELKAERNDLREIVVKLQAENMKMLTESSRFKKSVVDRFAQISEIMQSVASELYVEVPVTSFEQEISKTIHSTATNSMGMSMIHSPDKRTNYVNVGRRNPRFQSMRQRMFQPVATEQQLHVENMDLEDIKELLKEDSCRSDCLNGENSSPGKHVLTTNAKVERRNIESQRPGKPKFEPHGTRDRLSIRDMDIEDSQESLKEDQENEEPAIAEEQSLRVFEEQTPHEEEHLEGVSEHPEPCYKNMTTIVEESSRSASSLHMSSHNSLVTVLKFASSTPHSNHQVSRETVQMEVSPIEFTNRDAGDERCRLTNVSVRKKIFTNKSLDTKNSPCPIPLEPSVEIIETACKVKPRKDNARKKLADKTNVPQAKDPDYPIPIKVEKLDDIPMSRPKRKAAPTNLKEHNVNTKLRRN